MPYIVKLGDLYVEEFEIKSDGSSKAVYCTEQEHALWMGLPEACEFLKWELDGKIIVHKAGHYAPKEFVMSIVQVGE